MSLNLDDACTWTFQTVFDHVVTALAKQASKALDPDSRLSNGSNACLYKAPDGKKCAFGHLLSDDRYDTKMEGLHCSNIIREYFSDEELIQLQSIWHPTSLTDHGLSIMDLCSALQSIHDKRPVNQWESYFNHIAKGYGLKMPEVDWSACNVS